MIALTEARRRPFHCAFGSIARARMLQALDFEEAFWIYRLVF